MATAAPDRTPAGSRPERALVIGGGFAGVEAASALQKAGGFDVTLVSDRDYLYLFPISVWVPVRGIPFRRAQVPLRDIARKRPMNLSANSLYPVAERPVCSASEITAARLFFTR